MSDLTIHILHPAWLWLLLLAPVSCWLPKHRHRLPLPDGTASPVRDTLWHSARRWRLFLSLAILLAAMGLAEFRLAWTAEQQVGTRPDLACVLDVSGSMEARDWPDALPPPGDLTLADAPPSRLELAKDAVSRLCQQDVAEHYALVAFANSPVLVSPLVNQGRWLSSRLPQLQVQQFEDGTAIGEAIACALEALASAPPGRPACMILFTDGVDHTADGGLLPEEAALQASQRGVSLHAVGIGGRHGYHPVETEGGGLVWKARGEPPDFQRLKSLAQTTGGHFFQLEEAENLPDFLLDLQNNWPQTSVISPVRQDYDLSKIFILAALLCVVLALGSRWRHPVLQK